ncbi:MAG: ArsR family transcriptional regulator, lead/cadmium/zinc/bismuth-responsive transcriptional [Thermovirga sp.]|jgi:ArsR family transcriptional regulator|nr:MAG: Transcriptional regulator, ArsR family [Thermovirga lienii]MDN5318724.1 ArsR family transcriptional regulator, lead/cadmium/zinc/bismuth-responsive transcriptional [Thermovirga sp.]MDN5368354.1 ArsR family transcriptional regulator, lead/cadmium/zinc/bismuth-responsive transcriptional [Thermovirga sp.]
MTDAKSPLQREDLLCEVFCVHGEEVERARSSMLTDDVFEEMSGFYKLFSDRTRLKILWALRNGPLCVCDLCAVVGMSQPAVSQQLQKLRNGRIVKSRREGKVVYYSLDDEHIEAALDMAMEHVEEGER